MITIEQTAALRRYVVAHSERYNPRYWKQGLRIAWENGDYRPLADENAIAELQSLRNSLGPRWLTRYKLPPLVHYMIGVAIVAEASAAHGCDLSNRPNGEARPCLALDGDSTDDESVVTCPDCIDAGFGQDAPQ